MVVAGVLLAAAGSASAQTVTGGGSSFVYPLIKKWGTVYEKEQKVDVNYSVIGSGAGIANLINGTFDFACSDAPLSEKQLAEAKEKNGAVLHIPLALGGIVPAYNLKGIDKPLRLSGRVLADIFQGSIKKWNDPAIKELNAGVDLPDLAIAVVHRADASGSTYIFTDFLCKVSPDFEKQLGRGMIVKWPGGASGAKGNEGVAALVNDTAGAIGYVDLLYALKNKLKHAAVKNQEGDYVEGSLAAVKAAAEGALKDLPDDLRFSLTNAPGKDAYPIAGCTWAIIFAKQSGERGKRVVDFLRYATHDGQEYNTDLYYARLPKGLAEKIDAKLKALTFDK
jgi:phosphate transport system substrate-binding protein